MRREAIEEMIQALKNINNPEYFILRPESGVRILYSDDRVPYKAKSCSKHRKIALRHHLQDTQSFTHYHSKLGHFYAENSF